MALVSQVRANSCNNGVITHQLFISVHPLFICVLARTTAYQHMCRLGAARCIDGKVVRPAVVVESSGQLTMFHCHSSSQTKILAGQLEAQQD